jgi:hypothetical protein
MEKEKIIKGLEEEILAHHSKELQRGESAALLGMKIEDLKLSIQEAFEEKNQNEKEAIEVLD